MYKPSKYGFVFVSVANEGYGIIWGDERKLPCDELWKYEAKERSGKNGSTHGLRVV